MYMQIFFKTLPFSMRDFVLGNNSGLDLSARSHLRTKKSPQVEENNNEIACHQVSCSMRRAHEYISFTREEVVRHTTIHDKNISYIRNSFCTSYIHTYISQGIQILNYHCFLSGSVLVFPLTISQSSSDHMRLYLERYD
jgi:hypothetical protein